jgi:glyoxylase-like metal-dependent hydrolase (beta-lactamase superfamily II)
MESILKKKYIKKNIPFILGSLVLSVLVPGLVSYRVVQNQHTDETKIDSLISVKRINEKTILISFGADAVTAIYTQEGIVVVDAGISTGLTAKYRKIMETEFQSTRFKYVINTHGHHDHTRGNMVFGDAEIIGHENSIEEIDRQNENRYKAAESLKRIAGDYDIQVKQCEAGTEEWKENFTQKYRYLFASKDIMDSIRIKKPDILFTDSLYIHLTDVTLELFFFGRCHSESDILIYIPEMKILFTGDLFTRYGKPSVYDNIVPEKEKRKESVAWIEKRAGHIETIITGHGQVLGIEDLRSYSSRILTY